MAVCKECGEKLSFLNRNFDLCPRCGQKAYEVEVAGKKEEQRETQQFRVKREAEIEAILLTTESTPNIKIIQRIEIVTAECAYGMNVFKDMFAGMRDIIGGRSEAVQNAMRDARRTALYELKREAHSIGANAVVGVDLDYVEISAAGNMVMLVASGTAVVIEMATN